MPSSAQLEQQSGTRPADPLKLRIAVVTGFVALAFAGIAGQLVRLGLDAQNRQITVTLNAPIATSFARPDIVDRKGRLLATDVEVPSLYADPSVIDDRDEIIEKLRPLLPGLDETELRKSLSDRDKKFVWIWRGLAPKTAQTIHDLGLPGLAFRRELKRAYPSGNLAGHVLGHVTIDNRGVAGIERYIDEEIGADPVSGTALGERAPVRLSLDIGVQHTLEQELEQASRRYRAQGAAGLVIDIETGEVLASASLPDVDPGRPASSLDPARLDKVAAGTYELGSIFKVMTVAMALDSGDAKLSTMLDVRRPLTSGRFTIADAHPSDRPLSVAEIFIKSSNVGAGMLALQAGGEKLKGFLGKAALTGALRTEIGQTPAPQLPGSWDRTETITVAYGHGIAVAPLQFAAAAASVLNGGELITPVFIKRPPGVALDRPRIIRKETSALIGALMRRNVTDPQGTGSRADVPGYRVGGKTGTAEIPGRGGYRETAVISSFLAAFPMDQPRYLTLVMLFEPQPTEDTKGKIVAGVTAAPVSGSLIARIAPMLGVAPGEEGALAAAGAKFDASALPE